MKLSPATLATVIISFQPLAFACTESFDALYPTRINCGTPRGMAWSGLDNIAAPDYYNLQETANRLWDKGGTCTTPAGSGKCIRVGCVNTTGIWMCNTNGHEGPYSAECRDVSSFVYRGECPGDRTKDIWATCRDGGLNTVTSSSSGQAFVQGEDWNVITGYANCNHSPSNPPDHE